VNELGLMELVEESEESEGEVNLDADELFKKCENIPFIHKAKNESDGKAIF